MVMTFFVWWYGEGWRQQLKAVSDRIAKLLDTFSFRLILRTLFSPFRQISAGRVDGPIGVQIQAFVDRLISRFIGAIVRSAVLVSGLISIFASLVIGLLYIVFWPLIPILPVLGVVLMFSGWVPSL